MVPNNRKIIFEIIEASFEDNECKYDFLEFKDGTQNAAEDLGKACTAGKVIMSSGRTMKVSFVSDSEDNNKGFSAKWYATTGKYGYLLQDCSK